MAETTQTGTIGSSMFLTATTRHVPRHGTAKVAYTCPTWVRAKAARTTLQLAGVLPTVSSA